MNGTELERLLADVRAGDKGAFTRLYRELERPVFTIAWRILRSREAAEDVTQDVFLKLFCEPPDPSVKNPRAWIFQVARNRAIDAWRKQTDTDMDSEPPAADTFDAVVLRLEVEAAIAKLPCVQREVLTLHLNGGLRFHEIAPIVELSVSAAYRQYRKAIAALRDDLNGGVT